MRNAGFIALLLVAAGLAAWFSYEHRIRADWSAGGRNTLTAESRQLLDLVHGPVEVTAYVADDRELHRQIRTRIDRYRQHKPDLTLRFLDPALDPEAARQEGVVRAGQIVLRQGARRARAESLGEREIGRALARLARQDMSWVVFLEGHGEREHARLGALLRDSGLPVTFLNLLRSPAIPENTAVLVVAGPRDDYAPGEAALVRDYVERGGNLLWLAEPRGLRGLEPLAEALGIRQVDGVVVDANPELRAMLGIRHPAIVPVVDYGRHPVTQGLRTHTLFPAAGALVADGGGWEAEILLQTLERAWSETGSIEGDIAPDEAAGETAGPLALGLALSRPSGEGVQRVAVIGDSDFLADDYIGHGANLDLGANLFNWLAADDALLDIRPVAAPDARLEIGQTPAALLGGFFLVVLPLVLLSTGLLIRARRHGR